MMNTPEDMSRMPAVYVPHGGGPWPFVELNFGPPEMWRPLEAYLRNLVTNLPERPKAVLVVSAHWEEAVPTLMTADHPPMLYDYYGFPQESYSISWPAPGAPELAASVKASLVNAGFSVDANATRGFDHGTFVPLKLAVPNADIPTLQLSLLKSLDPRAHLAMGHALSGLRDEGVFCVGSGSSYHNMRGFGQPSSRGVSEHFDAWLGHAVSQAAPEREELLTHWKDAPGAKQCHPREEHLLPLHVMAGIGHDSPASVPFRGDVLGVRMSAVQFG
jgi:aromatic ring-opening dioxygenase catalytic subunit (LigB family)